MKLNELTAISPVDGRYRSKASPLALYFSEFALIKYRVKVEIEYFLALTALPFKGIADFKPQDHAAARLIAEQFSEADAARIKEIERTTNHDVKAVEYFIKEKFDTLGWAGYKEWIHFGLTSQDVNNTSNPLMMKEGTENIILPSLTGIINKLKQLAADWKNIPMLARTHGQPASPTKLGKEILVFVERLENQLSLLAHIPHSAKFGGATGNFNAHHVAFPGIDWEAFADNFVNKQLGLKRCKYTTQIEHYDNTAALFDGFKRINTILIDLSRDVWQYVSMEYFKQKVVAGEVGSSAMPHKVNPIDFENAEGNLGMANAGLEFMGAKLPISRLQRDLTDSTVLRNAGVPLAHMLIAYESLIKGLNKISVNEAAIAADLENNYAVVAEAIQTVLRRENYPNPYEALKALTRTGARINAGIISDFINNLDVKEELKEELRKITPFTFTGIF